MRGLRRPLTLFAAVAIVTGLSASLILGLLAAAPVRSQSSEVQALTNLRFAAVSGYRPLLLDLYLPAEVTEPTPVILWVHGGFWRAGSKEGGPALFLAQHGYAVASVQYRFSGEAPFPAQIHDVKAAVRWLRANADEYNLDPARIGAWGASAGGHLVALLGTSADVEALEGEVGGNLEYSSRVQAVVDYFGISDFLQMDAHALPESTWVQDAPDSPTSRLVGCPIQSCPEAVRVANPISYVTPDDPAFLILHGDRDLTVPHHQSELLLQALASAGVEVTLFTVAGAGHGGPEFATPEIRQMVLDFFAVHLR